MPLPSLESICTAITCTSEVFEVFYDDGRFVTEVLVQGALESKEFGMLRPECI